MSIVAEGGEVPFLRANFLAIIKDDINIYSPSLIFYVYMVPCMVGIISHGKRIYF
jgi:hypothetical protein